MRGYSGDVSVLLNLLFGDASATFELERAPCGLVVGHGRQTGGERESGREEGKVSVLQRNDRCTHSLCSWAGRLRGLQTTR
jgi:hypothetical protein